MSGKLPTSLDTSMGYLVRRTYRNFTRTLELRLKEYDITISMWFFLRLLWQEDGKTQKQLTYELGVRQPTTVSAMATLEKRGLIRRVPNPEDGRSSLVYLTKAGKALKSELAHYADEVNAIALQRLTPHETVALRKLLVKINGSLELARGKK